MSIRKSFWILRVAALTFWLYPGTAITSGDAMIFVNHFKNAKAAKDYYTQHLAPGDYFSKDAAEMKGQWHGFGGEMLHLSGEVKHEDFLRLCDNLTPDGEHLTPRMRDDRRVLTDFTFDTPKSVSLAMEMGGHNGGGDSRILTAMQESVRETMAEIEQAAQTRVRKNGSDKDRTTGNMIWAEHIHRTTRPVDGVPDPQLHCHATVFNATYDGVEKKWKAIQLGDVVRDKGYYQAAFHARLASKLKDLGYAIQKDGNSFKLAGIDRSTVDKFSRRTAVIEAEAARLGIEDALSKGKLGKRTREKKNKDRASMSELRSEWDARLTPEERLAIRTASSGWEQGDTAITAEQAKTYALEHSFQNFSAVSAQRLKEEALKYAVGSIRPEDVADIAQHREAIPAKHDGQLFVTTKSVLDNEIAFLEFAKDGQRKFQPFIAKWALEKPENIATRDALAGLSDEQKRAALHILNSPDQVVGARGGAGTGKTHMLQTVNAVISAIESRSGDYSHVHAFAQSTTASRGELRKVGFKDAQTLAMLLKSEKIQASVHRQVILIDEAGLLSSKDMRAVFDIAKKQEARVVLVGDYRQHSSIEAGDAFRLIEKEAGVRYAELKEIRRQRMPGYKQAVEAMSKGSGKAAQQGFDKLDKMGWITEAEGEDRHRALVKDYLAATAEGKSALIISPTNAEARRLTEELRTTLKANGAIGEERTFTVRSAMKWSEAQKGDVRNYERGMIVDFHQAVAGQRMRKAGKRATEGGFEKGEAAVVSSVTADSVTVMRRDGTTATLPLAVKERFQVSRAQNISVGRGDRIRNTRNGSLKLEGQAKGTDVNNGDVFAVDGFTKEGHIRLGNGKIMPKDWGHFDLGYVDTSYKSQGKTVDRVFISVGRESIPAANQQQWYVSASRGREQARIYVGSKDDMRNAIARTGQRLSAVELTHTRLRDSWRKRFAQSLERNRVHRFLKDRAAAIADRWRGREGVTYA
jgi:conjugative relaxase-like TrwC/TraI family protein